MRYWDANSARTPLGGYVTGSVTYASSIDSTIANLRADFCYRDGGAALPIVHLIHGYAETITALDDSVRRRWADSGFFVVVAGMRGRNGASGSRDASGREPHDIVDANAYVRALLPEVVDPERAFAVGYSGGGGTALALLAKSPDEWAGIAPHFGPSDYGCDPVRSWYATNPGFQASLNADVGATPSAQPAWWRTREHVDPIVAQLALAARARPGQSPILHLHHDADDPTVSVVQSDRLADALDAAGLADAYAFSRSTGATPTAERYLHGYPSQVEGLRRADAVLRPLFARARAWELPRSGVALVAGWLRARRFSVWLDAIGVGNPKTASTGGTTRAGRVTYQIDPDNEGGTFVLEPTAGPMAYRLEVGSSSVVGETSGPVEVTL